MKRTNPMNEEQKEAVEFAKQTSQELLSEQKGLCPVAIVKHPNNEDRCVVMLPSEGTQSALDQISQVAPWHVTVNEVWVYPPNQRDKRSEGILVVLCEGKQILRAEQCSFRRDREGGIYFEEWIDLANLPGAHLAQVDTENDPARPLPR
jgi:hypothetical protein